MRVSRLPSASGHVRRVAVAALVAFSIGLVVLVLGQGLSSVGFVRAVEEVAIVALVVAVLSGAVAFVGGGLGLRLVRLSWPGCRGVSRSWRCGLPTGTTPSRSSSSTS